MPATPCREAGFRPEEPEFCVKGKAMTTASHPAQHHHVMGLTLHNTAIGIGAVLLLV
jgi:hypothetical protein